MNPPGNPQLSDACCSYMIKSNLADSVISRFLLAFCILFCFSTVPAAAAPRLGPAQGYTPG